MKHSLLIFLISFIHFNLLAQKNDLTELSESLYSLDTMSYKDYANDINVDSIALVTGQKIIEILKEQVIKLPDSITNFTSISSIDSLIAVYTYSYSSGGTRGDIDIPVIQWRKKDGSYGVLGKIFGLEIMFYEIFKLPSSDKDLYMLIGNEKCDGRTFEAVAYVVQIEKNNLIVDYPAFLNQSPVLIYIDDVTSYSNDDYGCIACVNYDNNTLSIINTGADDEIKIMSPDGNFTDIKQKNTTLYFNGTTFILK